MYVRIFLLSASVAVLRVMRKCDMLLPMGSLHSDVSDGKDRLIPYHVSQYENCIISLHLFYAVHR